MDVMPDGRAGRGLLLILVTAIVSGVSTYVNLFAVGSTSSSAFVTTRNLLVALALVPVAIVFGRGAMAKLTRAHWGRLALIGLIGGAIPFLLFFRGLQLAAAGGGGITVSFLYRTLFLMAMLLGIGALGERFRARVAVGAALLLAGNALLLSFTEPIWTDGTGYVLAATALWAVEYTISRWTLKDLPSSTVAIGRMGFGALFLIVYEAATFQLSAVGRFSGTEWLWIGISAAFLTVFVITWYAGLREVEVGTATAVLTLGFPITYALTVAFSHAYVSPEAALGGVAIGAGVAVTVGRTLGKKAGNELLGRMRLSRPVGP